MAALTADKNIARRGYARQTPYPMADNIKIFKGSLVSVLGSSGYAIVGAATAATVCVGVAASDVDNTTPGHTAGGKTIVVESGCEFLLTGVTLTQASVSAEALLVDSSSVQTAATTNSIKVGRIAEYVSATSCWVAIPFAGPAI